MIEDNIENIRRNAISEIKEKMKVSKYLHPCNKERQEDMKKLEFENGYKFTCWMQQNGILKNPTKVRQEVEDICAQKLGFKNENERYKG
jgi:hypothetical protein